MIPGEDEFSDDIKRELALELRFAYKMLDASLSILEQRIPRKPPNGIDEIVAYRVANALCIKACKSFRSIHRLALVGATHDIDILSRSLFETTVALVFVLKTTVALGIKGFDDLLLTSELRAKVYAAWAPIRKHSDFLVIKDDPRFPKTIIDKIDIKRLEANADEARRDVGQFWAERLSKAKSYSGFNLKDLVARLDPDLSKWYAVAYVLQSKLVHASDAGHHVRLDETTKQMLANWHTSVDDVRHALISASALLLKCFWELDERYDFEDSPNDDKQPTKVELQYMMVNIAMLQRQHFPAETLEQS